jgi:hypothetical protein
LLTSLSVDATSVESPPEEGLFMEGTTTKRTMTKPIIKTTIKAIKQPLALLIT